MSNTESDASGWGQAQVANEKRLIDANEVERKLRIAISSWWCDSNSNAPVIARAMEDALQRVIYAETVDAVEVCRCKDCKYGIWNEEEAVWECVYSAEFNDETGIWFGFVDYKDGNDFCSDGERREGE